MKALTIRQPHAQLIVLGPKRIETRSWPTKYRGRLLIHAASSEENLFIRNEDGDFVPTLLTQSLPGVRIKNRTLLGFAGRNGYRRRPGVLTQGRPLPLGAIVGSCNLVDVVPIKRWSDVDKHNWDEPWIEVSPSGGLRLWPHGGIDYTDHLPYGDFTPGNYAWILEDAKPCEERCPVCWGNAETHHCEACDENVTSHNSDRHPNGLGGHALTVWQCATCNGKGICNPIPAKGKQGIWNWEHDESPSIQGRFRIHPGLRICSGDRQR